MAVVIPCFNDGSTLGEAVAATYDQEPVELVVVDDGSTDPETLQVLEQLRSEGVHIVSQANGGLSAARMAGVSATSAPYVLPLDADDVLVAGSIAPLADTLDARPTAVLAWGDTEIWGDVQLRLRVGRRLDPWQIAHLNVLPTTSMVRRDALLGVGGWQLRHGYEDWDLWMAFAERGWEGVYVEVVVQRYRRRSGRMLEGCIPRHEELYAELKRRHPLLFARRWDLWRGSGAPLTARALFPMVSALPLSEFDKSRLYHLANAPRQALTMRRRRRRAERLRPREP